jgi:hypothetical protein
MQEDGLNLYSELPEFKWYICQHKTCIKISQTTSSNNKYVKFLCFYLTEHHAMKEYWECR